MVIEVTMMPTEVLLGSGLKVRILQTLVRYPGREFTKRELARTVGASHVGVAKALGDLLAYDVVRQRVVGRAHAVSANPDSALLRGLADMFRAEDELRGRLRPLVRKWCARRRDVLFAALFGSYARGEAGPDSDVDLALVVRDRSSVEGDLDELREAVHRLLGRPLAPLLLTPAEARRKRRGSLLRSIRDEGVVLYRRGGWTLP